MRSNSWPEAHITALREHVAAGTGSYREIAHLINGTFGTSYTRTAVLAKVSRLGLAATHKGAAAAPLTTAQIAARREARIAKRKIEAEATGRETAALLTREPPRLECAPIVDIAEPRHLELAELKAGECRYPFGDHPPFTFCGRAVMQQGRPYCAHHTKLCLGEGTASERHATRALARLVLT
jgi:GcrA cell cycle regulator